MRIAFLNRERTWAGGDLIAIDATMEALRRFGVECWYGAEHLERADLVHIFHCNYPWSRTNFRLAVEAGKPYVVTPVFYPEDRGMGRTEMLEHLLRAEAVMPFSRTEGKEMQQWVGKEVPFTPVPNGTSWAFHAPNGGAERTMVKASAMRADDGKRWEVIAEACRRLNLPFTLLAGITHQDLPQHYRRCRVFVSASGTERMSLVIGEALCAGCRVLSTVANRGNEWYEPHLEKVDPGGSVEHFMRRIEAAYHVEGWCWEPNERARAMTWSRTARALVEVYQEVLAGVLC